MTTDRLWVDEMAIWKERCDFRLFGIVRVVLSPHKAWFTFFAFVKGQDAARVCPLTLDCWQRGGAVRPNPSWGRAPPTREIPGVCLTGRSQSLHSYQVLSSFPGRQTVRQRDKRHCEMKQGFRAHFCGHSVRLPLCLLCVFWNTYIRNTINKLLSVLKYWQIHQNLVWDLADQMD